MSSGVGRQRPNSTPAFAKAPPTNYATAQAFAASPLGAAILGPHRRHDQTYLVSFDVIEGPQAAEIADEEDAPLMEATKRRPISSAPRRPARSRRPNATCSPRSWPDARSAEALGDNPFLRRRLKADFGGDVGAYVEDLSARAAKFVIESEGRP